MQNVNSSNKKSQKNKSQQVKKVTKSDKLVKKSLKIV